MLAIVFSPKHLLMRFFLASLFRDLRNVNIFPHCARLYKQFLNSFALYAHNRIQIFILHEYLRIYYLVYAIL